MDLERRTSSRETRAGGADEEEERPEEATRKSLSRFAANCFAKQKRVET